MNEALKRLRQSGVRNVALVLVKLPGCKKAPGRNQRFVQLIDDRGFADSGIAGNQHQFRPAAGYYTITGVGSGKALDIPNVTTWPGTQLELWTPNGGTNQQWQIAPNDNGSYTIESRSDGYRLDVWNNSTTDGGLIDVWPAGNTANQQWTLVKVS